MDLKSTYNKIAEDWHKNHQQDDWWIKGTDKFVSFLKPGSIVLDIGCGGGTKAKYLINKGLNVIGIDFSEEMVKISKREIPKTKFLTLDLQNIENLKENFDGIFIQAVLLHFPKKEIKDVLEKIIRKLRDGGYLYIAVKKIKKGQPDEEVKIENDYGYQYKRFFSYFTPDELRNLLLDLKMKIVYKNVAGCWIQIISRK
mgnify:FL=1